MLTCESADERSLIRADPRATRSSVYQWAILAPLFEVDRWELCGYEPETESLLDRLSELAAILDPVPESIEAGIRAAFRRRHRLLVEPGDNLVDGASLTPKTV